MPTDFHILGPQVDVSGLPCPSKDEVVTVRFIRNDADFEWLINRISTGESVWAFLNSATVNRLRQNGLDASLRCALNENGINARVFLKSPAEQRKLQFGEIADSGVDFFLSGEPNLLQIACLTILREQPNARLAVCGADLYTRRSTHAAPSGFLNLKTPQTEVVPADIDAKLLLRSLSIHSAVENFLVLSLLNQVKSLGGEPRFINLLNLTPHEYLGKLEDVWFESDEAATD
jgi:hypothetical protein